MVPMCSCIKGWGILNCYVLGNGIISMEGRLQDASVVLWTAPGRAEMGNCQEQGSGVVSAVTPPKYPLNRSLSSISVA